MTCFSTADSPREAAGRITCKLKGFLQILQGTFTVLFQPTLTFKLVCSAQIFQLKKTLTTTPTSLSWSKIMNFMFICSSKP